MPEPIAPPHPFSGIRYFVFKQRQPSQGWYYHDSYLHETNATTSSRALLLQGWMSMVGQLDVIT